MGLSKEEQQQLDALTAKSKERDKPSGDLRVSLDLGDDAQVKRAQKFGFLPTDDDDDDNGGGGDDDDETPKRRGYFRD